MDVLRLSFSVNEALKGVCEGVVKGKTRLQMTGMDDEAGEDQAVVFLSSFSVDIDPNASTPELTNGYGISVD